MRRHAYFESTIYNDLGSALLGMNARFSGRTALTWFERGGEAGSRTYGELAADSAAFAAALEREGLAGRSIAIVSENSYEWLWAFFGITASGGVCVMVDVEQTAETLCSMIKRAKAELAIASYTVAPLIKNMLDIPIITIGSAPGLRTIEEFTMRNPAQDGENLAWLATRAPSPDSVAAIAYTSGTSSLPKPVMLTQRGIALDASEATAMVRPTEKVFSPLPLYHTYGLTCGALCILFHGSNLGLNGDVKRMTRDLALFDPEILMAVPLIVEMLHAKLSHEMEQEGCGKALKAGLAWFRLLKTFGISKPMRSLSAFKKKKIGSLQTIVCGGAHLSRRVAREMPAFGIRVLEGYGITECSPLVAVNRAGANTPHSAGLPLPCCKVKLVNGEILVSGPTLMAGYFEDEKATAAQMEGEWFKTGDMGRLDKRGFLHITGRKKNLIVLKNGKKIAPEEIESYVMELPLVREVMAYGAPSGESADDVRLAVTIFPDEASAEGMTSYEVLEQLQRGVDKLNSNLPAYKQIHLVNVSSKELDKTSSNKIKRTEARNA